MKQSEIMKHAAECLDNKRLNKQIIETLQIYNALTEGKGWIHHPVTKMWRGYEKALLWYGSLCYQEWIDRFEDGRRKGKKHHKSGEEIAIKCQKIKSKNRLNILPLPKKPPWLYCNYFTHCMKANLIRKNPEYYSKFWPDVEPMEGYFYPV